MFLYITADRIGGWTGGGKVTLNEWDALKELGWVENWDRELLEGGWDPWGWDSVAVNRLKEKGENDNYIKLAHFYAGAFPETVAELQRRGTKVCYTVAAHDVELSRKAHEDIGLPFPYEHLTNPDLFKQYIQGYIQADMVVCPSEVAAKTVKKQGRMGPITVIPHGCEIPKTRISNPNYMSSQALDSGAAEEEIEVPIAPLPKIFTVGYLGSIGADKGLKYLLQAWAKLNWKDCLLKIGGKDTTSQFMFDMVGRYGGGNIHLAGWQRDVSDFYNSISLYIQPSATEGFGIEVLEAMAHGRMVLCSDQAGASDHIWVRNVFKACDVDHMATLLSGAKVLIDHNQPQNEYGNYFRDRVRHLTWDKIRQRYVDLWKSML